MSNSLVELVGGGKNRLPERFLESLTLDELNFVYRWNGDADMFEQNVQKQFAHVIAILEAAHPIPGHVFSDCLLLIEGRNSGTKVQQFDVQKSAQAIGANVYYDQAHMVIKKATGEVVVQNNTVIPDPDGRRRPGLNPLAMLLSAFLRITKGKMTSVIDNRDYIKVWDEKRTVIRPQFQMEIIRTLSTVISGERMWVSVVENKTTLSKGQLLSFLYELLISLPDDKYYYLHTFVVYEFLHPFVPSADKRKKFRYTTDRYARGKEPKVPVTSYQIATEQVPRSVKVSIRQTGYPEVLIYRGGLKNTMKFVAKGTMTAALNSRTKGTALRGSDKSGMSFLSASSGYAGITTASTRREIRAVSMTGAALGHSTKVDIQLHKANDLPMIHSSLTKHFPEGDWKVIVGQGQEAKVAQKYSSRLITHGRSGSHLVVYEPYGMSSHSVKEKADNEQHVQLSLSSYMADSSRWKPAECHSGYTVFTAVYGDYPFMVPGKKTTTSHFFVSEPPLRPHYVYRFGLADQFHGIVSTIKDLALFGMSLTLEVKEEEELSEKEEGDWDEDEAAVDEAEDTTSSTTAVSTLVQPEPAIRPDPIKTTKKSYSVSLKREDRPLRMVQTESEWYNEVIASNVKRAGWWCDATPLYSSVVNVLHVEHSGMDVMSTMFYDEDVLPQDSGNYLFDDQPDEEIEIDRTFIGTGFEDDEGNYSEESSEEEEVAVLSVVARPSSSGKEKEGKGRSSKAAEARPVEKTKPTVARGPVDDLLQYGD